MSQISLFVVLFGTPLKGQNETQDHVSSTGQLWESMKKPLHHYNKSLKSQYQTWFYLEELCAQIDI